MLGLGGVPVDDEPAPAASGVATAPAPYRALLLAEGGLVVDSSAPFSSRVGVGAELPLAGLQSFFVGLSLRAAWRHAGRRWEPPAPDRNGFHPYEISSDGVLALAGLRLGPRVGRHFEAYLGVEVGGAGDWATERTMFQGWTTRAGFGLGFGAHVGARLHIAERLALFLEPAALVGELTFPPSSSSTGIVRLYFAATGGLGVAL